MNVIKTKVGNVDVLIETVCIGNQEIFPGMSNTSDLNGISNEVLHVFENAKEVISGIAQEMLGAGVFEVNPPDETKIGFGISLGTEGNILLVKGNTAATLNVEMTWKR